MMKVIKSNRRHFADHGWLATNWHFSFSDYYDPQNMNWSALRVFNDDTVQPGQGFPRHPHKEMEIITYVLDGAVEHGDNLGNKGIINAGEIQVMSAGRGIVHSEFNASKTNPVHFLQLWILPRNKGGQSRWEQRRWDSNANDIVAGGGSPGLHPVVSDGSIPGTLPIDQDATIYVGKLTTGQNVSHHSNPSRHAYLFVIDGQVTVNGTMLNKGDQARIKDEPTLQITATSPTHLMIIDLP
jgi:redox-sensitive bicupin YhaK (pirin superfamily)